MRLKHEPASEPLHISVRQTLTPQLWNRLTQALREAEARGRALSQVEQLSIC